MTKKEIHKLDKIWAEKTKENSGYKCELTGKSKFVCQLHPHHYIGRKTKSTRWYLPNGVCLSAEKHTLGTWSAHNNPEWFRKEMLNIRGDKWLEDIIRQSNKIFKGTFEEVMAHLNGERDDY